MLSAVVINNKSNRPGKGFFRLYSEIYEENVKAADEERVFIEEYKKIIKYDHWDDLKQLYSKTVTKCNIFFYT